MSSAARSMVRDGSPSHMLVSGSLRLQSAVLAGRFVAVSLAQHAMMLPAATRDDHVAAVDGQAIAGRIGGLIGARGEASLSSPPTHHDAGTQRRCIACGNQRCTFADAPV